MNSVFVCVFICILHTCVDAMRRLRASHNDARNGANENVHVVDRTPTTAWFRNGCACVSFRSECCVLGCGHVRTFEVALDLRSALEHNRRDDLGRRDANGGSACRELANSLRCRCLGALVTTCVCDVGVGVAMCRRDKVRRGARIWAIYHKRKLALMQNGNADRPSGR